jgi:hypothetical protein
MSTTRCDRQAHRRRQLNDRKSGSAEPAPVIDPFIAFLPRRGNALGLDCTFPEAITLKR